MYYCCGSNSSWYQLNWLPFDYNKYDNNNQMINKLGKLITMARNLQLTAAFIFNTQLIYELKSGKNIMFTFAIWTIIVNVYVIFLFILHFHFIIRNYHEMRICSFFIASLSFDKSTALANFISLMKVWSAKSRKLFFWLDAIKIWIMML